MDCYPDPCRHHGHNTLQQIVPGRFILQKKYGEQQEDEMKLKLLLIPILLMWIFLRAV